MLVNVATQAAHLLLLSLPVYLSDKAADDAMSDAKTAISALDQIDKDPTTRALAIRSIRP